MQNHKNIITTPKAQKQSKFHRFCIVMAVGIFVFFVLSSDSLGATNAKTTTTKSTLAKSVQTKTPQSSKSSRITDEEIGMLILPKDFKNSQANPSELMQAQDERLKDKSIDVKIAFYRSLLEINGVRVTPIYKDSDYIEMYFPNKSLDEKKAIAHKYMRARKKSGFFVGLSAASAGITQTYADGKYNRQNSVGSTDNGVFIPEITGALKSSVDFPLVARSVFVAFGGSGGYQNFFNLYFGSRIYGDVLIGGGNLSMESKEVGTKNVGSFFYMLGGLNADLLAEMPLSVFGVKHRFWREVALGGYFGINIGVMFLTDKANDEMQNFLKAGVTKSANVLWNYQVQVDYGLNAGLSFSLGILGKIEAGAKIPLDVLGLPSELRLGIESPASYNVTTKDSQNQDKIISKEILSKDIAFKRTPIFLVNYIKVF